MALPISPPQRRKFDGKTPYDCEISDPVGQSSVFYGSEPGFQPRVPQYDQATNHGWPHGRSPPTCPRSMRSANASTACDISGLLSTPAGTSRSSAGEDPIHTPCRVNESQTYTEDKAMDLDGTTSSGAAMLESSFTVSSNKIKICHSCRKPENAEKSSPWVQCSDCEHSNEPVCCTFGAAKEQSMQ